MEDELEENLDETNNEAEESDDKEGIFRKAVEITTGSEIDWEAEEEKERAKKQQELEEKKKDLDSLKAEEQKFLKSQDPITQIKIKRNFTGEERSWLIDQAKTSGKPLEEVIVDKEVIDLIQYRRKMNAPKIPNVLGESNEDQYLTTFQFREKLRKLKK
jgi:hypothetical protein